MDPMSALSSAITVIQVIMKHLDNMKRNGEDVAEFISTLAILERIMQQASRDLVVDQTIVVTIHTRLTDFLAAIESIKNQGLIARFLKVSANRRALQYLQGQIGNQITLLQTTFTVRPDETFDALHHITHKQGRDFWANHFGKDSHQVAWPRFQTALVHEMKEKPSKVDLANLHSILDHTGSTPLTVYKFQSFLSYFDSLQTWPVRTSKLLLEPWFYGTLSEEDAAAILKAQPVGSYIVRIEPSTELALALSYVGNDGLVKHSHIVTPSDQPSSGKFKIVNSPSTYDSVDALVASLNLRCKPLVSPLRDIWKHKSFFGYVEHAQVQALLLAQPTGTYLVRLSHNNPKNIIIAARSPDKVEQILIPWSESGFLADGIMYTDLTHLLLHYQVLCTIPSFASLYEKDASSPAPSKASTYTGEYADPKKFSPSLGRLSGGVTPASPTPLHKHQPSGLSTTTSSSSSSSSGSYPASTIISTTYVNTNMLPTKPPPTPVPLSKVVPSIFGPKAEVSWAVFAEGLAECGVSAIDIAPLQTLFASKNMMVTAAQYNKVMQYFAVDPASQKVLSPVIFDNIARVAEQSYFKGFISGGDAQVLLADKAVGTYLVRFSSEAPHLVISLKGSKFMEFKVFGSVSPSTGKLVYNAQPNDNCPNLLAIIKNYTTKDLPTVQISLKYPLH